MSSRSKAGWLLPGSHRPFFTKDCYIKHFMLPSLLTVFCQQGCVAGMRLALVIISLCSILQGTSMVTEESPENSFHDLGRMHVGAWHFDTPLLEFSGDVLTLDQADIAQTLSTNVVDVLQRLANVRFESYNGKASEAQIALRGFGENSGLRVLVVVDGQRMNRADLGGLEWQAIPIEDIATIDVIRGGQNTLYGNYALAGVVQITTRRGGRPRTKVSVQGGNDGYRQFTLDHAGSAKRWFWDAQAGATHDEGYREHSLTWNKNLAATVGRMFGADKQARWTCNAMVAEGYAQFPGPLLYMEFLADPRRSSNEGEEATHYRTSLFTTQWQSQHWWGEILVVGGFHDRRLDWTLDGIFARNHQWSATFSPRVRWGKERRFFIAGLDITQDRLDFDNFLDSKREITKSQAEISRLTTGPYLFAQWEGWKRLIFSAGVRYEEADGHYRNRAYVENQLQPVLETNRGPVPNPAYKNPPELDLARSYDRRLVPSGAAGELSLLWKVRQNWSVWAGYDRVYRYPALDETASYQGFALAEPVNANLAPETGHQADLGWKGVGENGTVSLTAYYLRLDGEIVYDNERNLNVNFADSRRYGLDGTLEYRQESWGCATHWSWVEASFVSGSYAGQRIPLVPAVHGVTSVWLRPLPWLEGTLYHTWSASRAQGNSLTSPIALREIEAFHRFDVVLSARTGPWNAFLRIDNLLDHSYAPLAYRGGFYPAPGRQWRIGVTFAFP